MENYKKKRVCVLGGGAAGLAAIRHIKESKVLTGIAFESSGNIGGIWKFDGSTPIYKGLRTNLPRQIMGYLDFPFPPPSPGTSAFLTHDEVFQFLNSYADKFALRDHIQLNTTILHIKPHCPPGEINKESMMTCLNFTQWEVTYETSEGGSKMTKTEIFDAVALCHGHFSKPLIPNVLNEFKGELIQSRDYNVPEPFTDKRVLIFGGGPSGIDIMLEIVNLASKVTLVLRKPPYPGHIPATICQKPSIKDIQGNTVIFEDGSTSDFDIILNCTGYEYELPFLISDESGLGIEDKKFITPLYRHMININFPSMALIGLNFRICPCMLFDCQTRYFVKILEGRIRLPSRAEMLLELKKEKEYRTLNKIPHSRSHQLEELQWPLMRAMGQEGDFLHLLQPYLPVNKYIYDKVAQRRQDYPAIYKNDEIQVLDNESFDIVEASV